MSGMQYNMDREHFKNLSSNPLKGLDYYIAELSNPASKAFENVSRKAILAGHDVYTAHLIHTLALEKSKETALSFSEIEEAAIGWVYTPAEYNQAMISKIDDWDKSRLIKTQASMRVAAGETGRYTQRRHKVSKSSNGKYPSNYIPPKKKRK